MIPGWESESTVEGCFTKVIKTSTQTIDLGSGSSHSRITGIGIDCSLVVPTSIENRPYSLRVLYLIAY